MIKMRHGLTNKEIFEIAKAQDFKCPITGHLFYSDNQMRNPLRDFLLPSAPGEEDYPTVFNGFSLERGKRYKKRSERVVVDHDHDTGYIRGLLSQEANLLLRQTAFGEGNFLEA